MFFNWLKTLLVLGLAGAVAIGLSHLFGQLPGFATYVVLVLGGVLLAVFLLKTSTLERITWKNRVAGLFLPSWCFYGSNGWLPRMAINAVVGWLLVGGLAILLEQLWPISTGLELSLYLCWLVDAMMMLALIIRKFTRGYAGSTADNSLYRMAVGLLACLALSGIAFANNSFGIALGLALLPNLIVVVPIVMIGVVVLGYSLSGKPIRWN